MPQELNLIGAYGPWAKGLHLESLPSFSFRNERFSDIDSWRLEARNLVSARMAALDLGAVPEVTVHRSGVYEGVSFEEISYQLPYGMPTKAVILKPENAKGKLPGILGLHCHGGNKFLGLDKISRTRSDVPGYVQTHHDTYYEGRAWANEVAKQGYVMMVHDAFAFGSRRVRVEDVPPVIRRGITDFSLDTIEQIDAYNDWASDHEHILAKSLFSAGTSWPAVFFSEDQMALSILAARSDVDASRLGCAGLSGGGLRTVMLGGLDPRIACAVAVGFMTTWTDLLLYKSYTHTWMSYVPALPQELDFPEILGIRAPLPTLVLNDIEDQPFTLSEMEKADKILQEVYAKAGASDRYRCSFHPGPHKFDKAMQTEAFGWFDQWLKG
ncbi:S9 family peptidase [Algoriphagus oliviformis]|nr:S9 family peptidase [Algoriphagus oliviformis]